MFVEISHCCLKIQITYGRKAPGKLLQFLGEYQNMQSDPKGLHLYQQIGGDHFVGALPNTYWAVCKILSGLFYVCIYSNILNSSG